MEFDPLPPQRLAIEAALGPTLVIAGPGAGKTFCLIGRIEHLIRALRFRPERICAVTFTNRAAEEISDRLRRALGTEADEITRGTLHSLCIGVLRERPGSVGLANGFGIVDEDYQSHVLGRLGVHPKRRGQLATLFGRRRLQNYDLTPGDEQLFQAYEGMLRRRNAIDFDDIIVLMRRLLNSDRAASRAVAARWDYILVDEFQDLNEAQYDIVKRLVEPHRNIFIVGDDEQSIYSWTGADPRILERFAHDFGLSHPVLLDRNCRCSIQIFETARRLLTKNPTIFNKTLTADRASAYEVCAFAFPDEQREAEWLVADLTADRSASGLGWGDYAVLYRKHQVGHCLESELVRAGIPCRASRGRSAADDDVIGFVVAALRVMRDPTDGEPVEALAERVLPGPLLQEVRTALRAEGSPLDRIRELIRTHAPRDPDTRKLWRFIYHVENLSGLYRAHNHVSTLVDDVLSRGIGPYRSPLEDHHDELTDPANIPEAVILADRLAVAVDRDLPIELEPQGGLEIPLRNLLLTAGLRRALYAGQGGRTDALALGAKDGGVLGLGLVLFKALQLLETRDLAYSFRTFVAFDLETTDDDPGSCEIVEIGGAKVVDGLLVERFHSLVRPSRPISPGAQKVHGRSDTDVLEAPTFREVWPAFLDFVKGVTLVAHNGLEFDVPVLKRMAQGLPGADGLSFFDTLPLARSLSRDSARLGDLAVRFGIDPGQSHHALDDAVTLVGVFLELQKQRLARARKSALTNLLDGLGLALALDPALEHGEERALLRRLARPYTLGRFTDCLEFYEQERTRAVPDAPSVDDVVERLGGRALRERLQTEVDPSARFPISLGRLRVLMDGPPLADLEQAVTRLLDRVALSTSEGAHADPGRVNLLTLHSTKGLEFSRVYIVGVEDYQLPGYYAATEHRESEIQESRRLLYVGMTRARDRLVLTSAAQRAGLPSGGRAFLDEMGLVSASL